MRRRWVMGNWKMHGTSLSAKHLLEELNAEVAGHTSVVVFPPAIYLPLAQQTLHNPKILLGSQNIYPALTGAFTGEISVSMCEEFGCEFVLVGHSERRHVLGETSAFIAKKFTFIKEQNVTPVLCVGETLEERQQGLTKDIIRKQLSDVADNCVSGLSDCIIAYEPVWAIGTGQAASFEQIQDVHGMIRSYLNELDSTLAEETSILYGGSVTPDNAVDLFALENVDGGLVGGASLDAARFIGIYQCIN